MSLETWKAKAIHEVTLEADGSRVGLKLPSVRACMIAGGVPLDVVQKMETASTATNGDAPAITLDDLAYDSRLKAELIRQMVKTLDGEPIEMTAEDVGDLEEAVQDELLTYATRQRPLDPKAD